MSFFSAVLICVFYNRLSTVNRHHFGKEKKLSYKNSFVGLVCIRYDIEHPLSPCADIDLDSVKDKDKWELTQGICGSI